MVLKKSFWNISFLYISPNGITMQRNQTDLYFSYHTVKLFFKNTEQECTCVLFLHKLANIEFSFEMCFTSVIDVQ